MEFQHQSLIKQGFDQGVVQGFDQGVVQGFDQGKFEMALEIKEKHGIEEAVLLSGFSREELERGKMNDR